MIYTVTFNPSLDYMVAVNHLQIGKTNRAARENISPGGKGINVSMALNNLGMESTALGFVAGFTGQAIADALSGMGLCASFIKAEGGMSRINIKLCAGEETEINGIGPVVSADNLACLCSRLDGMQNGDILVLSGSVPAAVSDTVYGDVMRRYREKDILCVVDAGGGLLKNALPLRPFLIKPNRQELEEIFGTPLHDSGEMIACARKLQSGGAKNVIVSLAGDGAVMVTEDGQIYETKPPRGKVQSSVGAGDSMVAGFLYSYVQSGDLERSFYYGVCTGSASAFSQGLAAKPQVEALLAQMGR